MKILSLLYSRQSAKSDEHGVKYHEKSQTKHIKREHTTFLIVIVEARALYGIEIWGWKRRNEMERTQEEERLKWQWV